MFYDLLIFDLDGTLADHVPASVGILNYLAEKRGLPAVRLQQARRLDDRSPDGLSHLLPLPWWRQWQIARRINALLAREADAVRLHDGIPPALEHLGRHDLRIAVVSAWSRPAVRSLLGRHRIAVDHVEPGRLLSGEHGRLARVLTALRVRPHRALYISDRLEAAGAARMIGVNFGAVAWGRADLTRLLPACPDEIFQTPRDLVRLSVPCTCCVQAQGPTIRPLPRAA